MSFSKAPSIAVLCFSFFLAAAAPSLAASFSLSPSNGVCIPGGTFDLNIVLQSDDPSSGATAILEYDSSILEALQLSNGDIFPQSLVRSIDPDAGTIRLDAGVDFAEPAYHTGSGTFGTINFKVLRVGSASISFDFTSGSTTDSNVAHAETHKDILTSASGGSYTFREDNSDTSLDASCASGGGDVTTTPTPTPTTPPGATPTPTTAPGATPTTPPAGGGAPEGGILEPTIFLSLLSFLMIGAGLILK